MINAADALTIDPNQRLKTRVQELETGQAQEITELKEQMNELRQLVYPLGPSPKRDKQARAIWWKLYIDQRKEKGEDVSDWPDEPPPLRTTTSNSTKAEGSQ